MEKTWISTLLPKDEYREKRLLYFIAEAVFILGIFLFIYLIFESYITKMNISGDMLALFSVVFLSIYITLRSIFTGIEYPEFATKKQYKEEKRKKIYTSIKFWFIFIILFTLFKGIPTNSKEIFNLIGTATIAAIVLFILNYFSLKKSYEKNKDLLDN